MLRPIIHLILHFLIPGVAARFVWKARFQCAWLIMISTMIVDMDHLLAYPVYDPNRCSIGFHPLHSYVAIGIYGIMTAVPKLRMIGTGLLIHMILDFMDCI